VSSAVLGAQATQDMVEAENNIQSCYSKALAAHAAEVDAVKKRNVGPQITPAGATAAVYFDDYRKSLGAGAPAPTAWCTIGHASSSSFGGSAQQVEDASCAARIEIHLAQIAVSEVDLAAGRIPLSASLPDGTPDDLHALIPQIVAKMLFNTPGDQDIDTAEVTAAFDGAIAASKDLCDLVEDAGMAGGGTLANQLALGCTAKAIGMLVTDAQAMAQTPDR
jgi:hypothetical protein